MQSASEFIQELARQHTTKRGNKNRSGRSGRRAYNSNLSLQSVGGYRSVTKAIYAGLDENNTDGTTHTIPVTLCHVVPSTTGYTNTGEPFRSPQQLRSLGGRGI